MYRGLCRILGYGKVLEALACSVSVQLPHCVGTQVPLAGFDRSEKGDGREGYSYAVRMARSKGIGAKRASGSRPVGVFATSQAVDSGLHGFLKGKLAIKLFKRYPGLRNIVDPRNWLSHINRAQVRLGAD
jgi:hypothetical protein